MLKNRPISQQRLAKTIIDPISLRWFNRNVYSNETALLECTENEVEICFKSADVDMSYVTGKELVHHCKHEVSYKTQEDNMQFFIWHGSQNLCQTTTWHSYKGYKNPGQVKHAYIASLGHLYMLELIVGINIYQ